MSRTMGDSSTFGDVPSTVAIVAAYANGKYGVPTSDQFEADYPSVRYGHVLIDVNGSRPDAQVRDWETGDKSGSLEQWVIDHNKTSGKKDAVVYCNRSTIAEVRHLTGSQVLGTDYFLWVSTLDGSVYKGSGIIACQDKGQAQTGGHWDSSIVFDDDFWQADAPSTDIISVTPVTPAKPDCRIFQNAVRTKPDSLWGAATDKNAKTVISATAGNFPYGIKYAQQIVDTVQDGLWGAKSKAMLAETVTTMQNALTVMGFSTQGADGIWGPHTSVAYLLARNACHI